MEGLAWACSDLMTSSISLGSPGVPPLPREAIFFSLGLFTFSTNVFFSYICKNYNLIPRCLANRFPVSAMSTARLAALNALSISATAGREGKTFRGSCDLGEFQSMPFWLSWKLKEDRKCVPSLVGSAV